MSREPYRDLRLEILDALEEGGVQKLLPLEEGDACKQRLQRLRALLLGNVDHLLLTQKGFLDTRRGRRVGRLGERTGHRDGRECGWRRRILNHLICYHVGSRNGGGT